MSTNQPPSDILRLMSLELAKGSTDLLELLGQQQATNAVAEGHATANGSSGGTHTHQLANTISTRGDTATSATVVHGDLATIFSMHPDERYALFQSLQNLHAAHGGMGPPEAAPPPQQMPSSVPVSSSSMNSSGNLPDPFASLGLNSGDWLGQMLGNSLQGMIPPEALATVPPVTASPAQHESLAKLPAKTAPLLLNNSALGTSAAGRVRRRSARAAAAASDDDEDTPFANFVAAHDEAIKGTPDDGARGVRRKAEEVDWRTVSDPEERKRLRRMAKNRRTAAASRERRKVAMDNLSSENATLKMQLAALQQQLAQERVGRTAAEAEVARLRSLMKQQP